MQKIALISTHLVHFKLYTKCPALGHTERKVIGLKQKMANFAQFLGSKYDIFGQKRDLKDSGSNFSGHHRVWQVKLFGIRLPIIIDKLI